MATEIKFKRSSTQNDVPSVSDLALGEIAINTYHGRMYTEKNVSSWRSKILKVTVVFGPRKSTKGYQITSNNEKKSITQRKIVDRG